MRDSNFMKKYNCFLLVGSSVFKVQLHLLQILHIQNQRELSKGTWNNCSSEHLCRESPCTNHDGCGKKSNQQGMHMKQNEQTEERIIYLFNAVSNK